MVWVMRLLCFSLLRRTAHADNLAHTLNGPPGESCAPAETWARNLLGLNLQWGRRDVEAAALDDQSVVQFLGLQGLACASGGEIDFLGGAATDTGYLSLR